MQLSKKPIVLYDGILNQLHDQDNIGRSVFTVVSKNTANDGDSLYSFTEVHANTSNGSFLLKLELDPQIGDIIKILDIKSVFSSNPILIDPQGNNIEGKSNIITLDVSGLIIEFIYAGSEDGWLMDIGGNNLNSQAEFIEYDIAPSTATIGSREGLLVYQTDQANTVDLTNASNDINVPAIGIIRSDGNTYVNVATKSGLVCDVKPDSDAAYIIEPGDHIFMSANETGKVTHNIENQSAAVFQRVGTCNASLSEGYIKINFWPNPEIYK